VAVQEPPNASGEFLAVYAALLLDNIQRFDDTVATVSDYVMATKPSRDLVVVLQSFDRLKQEFDALGDTLTRYAIAHDGAPLSPARHAKLVEDLIAGISVNDLKERLMSRLNVGLAELPLPEISAEEAAQVGIDVVY
jgi:hypothetical protein